MKNLLFFILCISFFPTTLFAQAPDTLWTKSFGGSSVDDWGQSVQETTDGGYIITGTTARIDPVPPHDSNVWLIKTDMNGDTLWTKSFGGSNDDRGYSVKRTSDGGYIITGYTYSFGADSGNVWLVKTNANGDTLWTRTYRGNNHGIGYSVAQTSDDGYIITGRIWNVAANHVDLWLIKTDSFGDTLWTRIFGSIGYDEGRAVQQTSDGGYIATGVTNYNSGFGDIWLIKTDSYGDTLWTKRFDGSGDDWSYSVQQTTDGGYIVCGYTRAYGVTYSDVWLIKTDSSGDTLWTKTFGRGVGYCVQQTSDEGYIISGSWPGHSIIRTDAAGDSLWSKSFWTHYNEHCYFVQQSSDGGYIITGAIYSSATFFDLRLIKVAPEPTAIGETPLSLIDDYLLRQNYPNPFNPATTIKYELPVGGKAELTIFNLLGQEIRTLVNAQQPAGAHQVQWDGRDESGKEVTSGIYFYQLKAGDPSTGSGQSFTETKKMVLLK